MQIWADFSGKPPGAVALLNAGFTGVLRYIGIGSEGKQIQRAEHDDYVKHGIRIGLVAELHTGDAWESGNDFQSGVDKAIVAYTDMQINAPTAEFICCAADAHAPGQPQINDAVQYAKGFASILGYDFSGFYGFNETSRAVYAANICRVHWRCGSEPQGDERKWIHFWQRNQNTDHGPPTVILNGTTIDINDVLNSPGHPVEISTTPHWYLINQ